MLIEEGISKIYFNLFEVELQYKIIYDPLIPLEVAL